MRPGTLDQLKTVARFQVDVDDRGVRVRRRNQAQRLGGIGSLAAGFQFGLSSRWAAKASRMTGKRSTSKILARWPLPWPLVFMMPPRMGERRPRAAPLCDVGEVAESITVAIVLRCFQFLLGEFGQPRGREALISQRD